MMNSELRERVLDLIVRENGNVVTLPMIDNIMQLIAQQNRALIERIRGSLPKDVRPYLANNVYYDGRKSMLNDVTVVLTVIEEKL